MIATAEARAQALSARVDAARAVVVELRSRISELEGIAHRSHVSVDFEAGAAALAELGPLRPELVSAEATLTTLELAAREIAEHVRIEQHRAALDVAEQRYEAALAEAHERLAEVAPGLGAVQQTLREALAAEQAAGQAGVQAHGLRIALGAPQTAFSSPSPVRGLLERHPLWRAVANHRPED